MTDPDIADHVYIEPLTAEVVERIIEKEKPDAILPNLGGQMGLNLSMELARNGFLDRSGCLLYTSCAQMMMQFVSCFKIHGAVFFPAANLSMAF